MKLQLKPTQLTAFFSRKCQVNFYMEALEGDLATGIQLSNAQQFSICMFSLHQLDFLFYYWIRGNLTLGKYTL